MTEMETKDYIMCDWCGSAVADRVVWTTTSKVTTFFYLCGFICWDELYRGYKSNGHKNIKATIHPINYEVLWSWR